MPAHLHPGRLVWGRASLEARERNTREIHARRRAAEEAEREAFICRVARSLVEVGVPPLLAGEQVRRLAVSLQPPTGPGHENLSPWSPGWSG
jgi:hypothetical protein